jgi:uncharacterized membrane protein YkvA (DUF1232 family)
MVRVAVAVLLALAACWLAMVITLAVTRPDTAVLRESLRLLPDTARLIHRLATDPMLARGSRVRLWLLLGYLALPIDLVPDFIPVLGYADDVIVISIVLRSVIRRAGADAVRRQWPGTPAGLTTLAALCRLPLDPPPPRVSGDGASPG